MMALGQTWVHRVDGDRVVIVDLDDATVTAIVFPDGGNDWTRVRFIRATFTEMFRWEPTCTRQR